MKLAAGLIIYRVISNEIQYLLMQASYGIKHWSPPKGHLDEGEDYFEAAVRETEEEAGLKHDVDFKVLDKEFKLETSYLVNEKPKRVLYWFAKVDHNIKITLSHEHIDFKWLNLADSLKLIDFEPMHKILNDAEQYIRKLEFRDL